MFGNVLTGQKKPAEQGLDVAVILPKARQLPELHVLHDDACVKEAPPTENVPGAHGVELPRERPAGQK